jgi:cytidyltransferase-like protein
MKKVLVFGTFDGVHDGHRALLKQAKGHGDYLIVAVAHDHIVEMLKKHSPRLDLGSRMDALIAENIAEEVIAGDVELGTYEIVKDHMPSVIALGYDQKELASDLRGHMYEFNWDVEIVVLNPHEPEKYKSSRLNRI